MVFIHEKDANSILPKRELKNLVAVAPSILATILLFDHFNHPFCGKILLGDVKNLGAKVKRD